METQFMPDDFEGEQSPGTVPFYRRKAFIYLVIACLALVTCAIGAVYYSNHNKLTTIDIQGRVINKEGKPLEDVRVRVQDDNKSAKTDQNGYFRIRNTDIEATLIISQSGYATKEVKVTANLDGIVLY